jgi:hypothetical protein
VLVGGVKPDMMTRWLDAGAAASAGNSFSAWAPAAMAAKASDGVK